MEGVVLFADDHIYSENRPERALFESLRSDLPVLGVQSLELASKAVQSIGTFSAVVLDWQYSQDDSFEDIAEELGAGKISITTAQKEDAAYDFLLTNNFYSLIYIFSEKDIEETYGQALREKFGNRIIIEKKDENFTTDRVSEFKKKILQGIDEWKESNKNLSLPLKWTVAINESIQQIFKELSEAEKDWILEIYKSAQGDGVDPELFVIELLQLILSESLVQNAGLIEALKNEGDRQIETNDSDDKKKSLSKLFSRLHYSELKPDAPLMTGDICEIEDNVFGIIITPECDIKKVKTNKELSFDLLKFSHNSLEEILKLDHVKKNKKSIFFQVMQSLHFFPSLPLLSDDLNKGCVIDFTTDSIKINSKTLQERIKIRPRKFKVNSPFIQQLRQRYISHLGRVGTPAVHTLVRDWNIN
ncbi:hypothetical protein KZP23_16480 [Echinicola marina]|uniref:hypothetical protein n=1 Tax=Echinicola marina TaxID=2859768 RepID=UPI001CF61073|nr:hypothetical protein [Echinicola marina]UCS92287.1 hypothetical protein KZP23_16480 [Echinicola marina]